MCYDTYTSIYSDLKSYKIKTAPLKSMFNHPINLFSNWKIKITIRCLDITTFLSSFGKCKFQRFHSLTHSIIKGM